MPLCLTWHLGHLPPFNLHFPVMTLMCMKDLLNKMDVLFSNFYHIVTGSSFNMLIQLKNLGGRRKFFPLLHHFWHCFLIESSQMLYPETSSIRIHGWLFRNVWKYFSLKIFVSKIFHVFKSLYEWSKHTSKILVTHKSIKYGAI